MTALPDAAADVAAVRADTAAATFNTANAAWRSGDWAGALAGYTHAVQLEPTLAEAHLGRARCLVQLGEWMAAREAFAATLRLAPRHYSAWLEAGHLCRQMGLPAQAEPAYRRAMAAAPQRFEAPLGLARLLLQGRRDAAWAAYQQALACWQGEPRGQGGPGGAGAAAGHPADLALRMGQYALEAGEPALAVQALQAGLAQARSADECAALQTDLGEALWRLGRVDEALATLTAASAAEAEPTLTRLGQLAFRLNHWQEALAVLRRCVALHPASAQAHWNLAHLLAECWQMDEAQIVLTQAEALGPVPGAAGLRASMQSRRGDADAALAAYRAMVTGSGAAAQLAAHCAAMTSLYSDTLSAPALAALHRELFAPLGQDARASASFVRAPLAGRRLRVGWVTADLCFQHPVNIFMQPVLRELDRRRIELTVYFTGSSQDDQTRLARQRAEHWVEAAALNDAQLARRIDADGIDLLLDLSGHTGENRMALFAQRAAPVQATYLGYPGSTGVPNIDWLIGDAVVTPPGCEALYSERIARLPGTVFCYAPEADYPLPDFDAPGRASRPLTFGSFNTLAKLTPRTLRLWAAVLQAVPDSRLLLKTPSFMDAGAQALMRERLAALGVADERVELRGPSGLADMMAEYADIDIALDPLPYNGGTTSLQAMWMGVPVLCQAGGHFVSRMGASFMTAAGLPDWVATDDAGLLAAAQRLAADRPALLALKRGLRERLLAHSAWNAQAHTRALEGLWLQMAEGAQSLRTTP